MPFNETAAPTRCLCALVLAASLLHSCTVDPHPHHADHHEASHAWHVPEPGHSTEPVDPTVNGSPAVTGAPPAGYGGWSPNRL